MTPTKINQELLEALKELRRAEATPIPPHEDGMAAQHLWGEMQAKARYAADVAIANAERAQTQADDLDSRVRTAEGQ